MDSLAGWLAGYPAGEGVDKHTNVYTTYAHKHNGTHKCTYTHYRHTQRRCTVLESRVSGYHLNTVIGKDNMTRIFNQS